MRLKLVNANLNDENPFNNFVIEGYTFHSIGSRKQGSTYTLEMAVRDNRNIICNASVEYNSAQQNSYFFKGNRGTAYRPRRRKKIEDILCIVSILTGRNWELYAHKWYNDFPVTASNHSTVVSRTSQELSNDLNIAIQKVNDAHWRNVYRDGFHVVMFRNNVNILVAESRFLSNMIIWEFLYSCFYQESDNLHEIIRGILYKYWPQLLNQQIFQSRRVNGQSKNIFYVLRNQVAHNGRLPIDRNYAELWMKMIPVSTNRGQVGDGLMDYLDFFNKLTQAIVLKTLGVDIEHRMDVWNFYDKLRKFLTTGKLDMVR